MNKMELEEKAKNAFKDMEGIINSLEKDMNSEDSNPGFKVGIHFGRLQEKYLELAFYLKKIGVID